MATKKTDLTKILSVSGNGGLFEYIAQARNGAIARNLADDSRTCLNVRSKITSLEDISIYTDEGEMKLSEVLLKLKAALGEKDAPSAKASDDELRELFAKAVPDYDANRFYVSHMRKVVLWYNLLKKHASLDFMTDEDRKAEAEAK